MSRKLLDFVEDVQKLLEPHTVALLNVMSLDGNPRRVTQIQGKLYPAGGFMTVYRQGQAADHHEWIEVPQLLFERIQFDALYLDTRARYMDGGRDHIPVGTVTVFQSH